MTVSYILQIESIDSVIAFFTQILCCDLKSLAHKF